MTERLTEEELAIFPLSTGDIAKIREHHFPVPYRTDGSNRLMCAQDDAWWPCALIQALDTIDALQVENEALRLGVAIPCHVCTWGQQLCKITGKVHELSDWTGWPGASCLHCWVSDAQELCLADNCAHVCHSETEEEHDD